MVSLKVQREAEFAQQRLSRLQSARRQAFDMGVAAARHYQEAKGRQQSLVREEIRVQMAAAAAQQVAGLNEALEVAETNRGAAMRAADELRSSRALQGTLELSAWEAEKQLQRQRALLALEARRFELKKPNLQHEDARKRREALASIEAPRPKVRAPLLRPGSEPSLQQRSASLVVVEASENLRSERAADAAAAHALAQQEKHELEQSKVKQLRKQAQQRASEALVQKRHEELLRQQQHAREQELQKTLMDATLRRSSRPGQAEFQEEEARRAQRINHQAHLDFERVFLSSEGWNARERPAVISVAAEGDDTGILLDVVDPSLLCHCVYALPCRLAPAEGDAKPHDITTEVSTDSESD